MTRYELIERAAHFSAITSFSFLLCEEPGEHMQQWEEFNQTIAHNFNEKIQQLKDDVFTKTAAQASEEERERLYELVNDLQLFTAYGIPEYLSKKELGVFRIHEMKMFLKLCQEL